jgi:hypothetical protein
MGIHTRILEGNDFFVFVYHFGIEGSDFIAEVL